MDRKVFVVAALAAACASDGKGSMDLGSAFGADEGKADAAKSTKLVDDLALDSVVNGTFDRKVRVYGYVLDAKRGAKLHIELAATAGADAIDIPNGTALDTLMDLYGPFESTTKPGQLLASHDDDGANLAAPPIDFTVEDDAHYLLAFTSWEDTGAGRYSVSVSCEGTDFQCRRPDWTRPCKAGTLYIQGGKVEGDTTWDTCDVVLLEPTTVSAPSILTVKPGVVVKGNFLGSAPFGNVRLIVDGTLQAAGTPEHPIAFTALKSDGWGGILLRGPSSSISNAFIEKASVGVEVFQGAGAELTDVVLQGTNGNGQMGQDGVRAGTNVDATFTRALVKGFRIGLHLSNAQRLFVEDSVVRENQIGVQVDGLGGATTSCGSPPAVTVWRDPVITHSDIVKNTQYGIVIQGSDVLLQVSRSNIQKNGYGLFVMAAGLNPMSFLRENNIHDNTNGEVYTYHRTGTLDISGNYWVDISDPELSQNWQRPCNGAVSFTGFAPVTISDAGPRPAVLTDPVKQQTWQQSQ